ncbi:MAG: hypothetical protein KME49_27730 [Brasilonema octagenarum HA4186-MV1]|jgi:hypothetical protein|uniref:Uncharacterized protein n=1 Tax=Brasilonema octagenarum UFV-OR1 TaxID=417115 RepID=A0ABX1MHC1_9CYAN|nr:hypothetical protein [Brasilonema octagenarum HA4186-MV1]NMF65277.1 hypothetical protein [Brasilonema octagenarum UFV-OR1]
MVKAYELYTFASSSQQTPPSVLNTCQYWVDKVLAPKRVRVVSPYIIKLFTKVTDSQKPILFKICKENLSQQHLINQLTFSTNG